MKKIIFVLSIILTSILLSGCQEKNSLTGETEQQAKVSNSIEVLTEMPDIVFMYSYQYYPERFAKCVFDKDGNIYYSCEEEVFYLNYKDMLELYTSGELKNKMELIGTIDTSELEENFQSFLEIMRDGGVNLTSDDWIIDEIVPIEKWYGLYYDKDGNVEITLLYLEDEGEHYTNDARVDKLVYWVSLTMAKHKPSSS